MPIPNREITALETYWDRLFDGTALPDRKLIDPRRIESSLPYTFIAERMQNGITKFRVAGAHLQDLMGMDVRGMPISALFTPESRDRVGRAIQKASETPAQVRINIRGPETIGQPELAGTLILMPLATSQPQTKLLLGALETEGQIGRPPRRFEIKLAAMKRIYFAEKPKPAVTV
ncbi:MAG: PAS domain-containing protein, partial [Paracoccaceae bacterium]|nr:PAS domain-containing protein [Paracoccaceae bacterium]